MVSRRRSLGRMSHRFAIMSEQRVADGRGGYARGDVVAAVAQARFETLSIREQNVYDQRQERATHSATMRTQATLQQGATVYLLARSARAPAVGSSAPTSARAMYVVAIEDLDPDQRPGEFQRLVLREGGNL